MVIRDSLEGQGPHFKINCNFAMLQLRFHDFLQLRFVPRPKKNEGKETTKSRPRNTRPEWAKSAPVRTSVSLKYEPPFLVYLKHFYASICYCYMFLPVLPCGIPPKYKMLCNTPFPVLQIVPHLVNVISPLCESKCAPSFMSEKKKGKRINIS